MTTPAEIVMKYTLKLTKNFTDSSQNYACVYYLQNQEDGPKDFTLYL